MKKRLIYIFFIFVVLSIVFGLAAKKQNYLINQVENLKVTRKSDGILYEVETYKQYFLVKNIVVKFYEDYSTSISNDAELSEYGKNRLYDSLDVNYLNYSNITKENILNKINEPEKFDVNIDKVYYFTKEKINTYLVETSIRNRNDNTYLSKKFVIVTDNESLTYSLFLNDFYTANIEGKFKKGEKIELPIPNEIAQKQSNNFKMEDIQTTQYLSEIYDNLREYILFDTERAYSMLYHTNFKSKEEFNNFVNDNRKDIYSMSLRWFSYKKQENIEIYSCKDRYKQFELIIYANGYNDIKFEINKI